MCLSPALICELTGFWVSSPYLHKCFMHHGHLITRVRLYKLFPINVERSITSYLDSRVVGRTGTQIGRSRWPRVVQGRVPFLAASVTPQPCQPDGDMLARRLRVPIQTDPDAMQGDPPRRCSKADWIAPGGAVTGNVGYRSFHQSSTNIRLNASYFCDKFSHARRIKTTTL